MKLLKAMFTSVPKIAPQECEARVRAGRALVIDVREPAEWPGGVVAGAALLPLSDLHGAREKWKPFLAAAAGRELVCYCAAGGRSAIAAKLLAAEGFAAANGGGIGAWREAGCAIVAPRAE
jgi:rhodanese-related sulfurtransferase